MCLESRLEKLRDRLIIHIVSRVLCILPPQLFIRQSLANVASDGLLGFCPSMGILIWDFYEFRIATTLIDRTRTRIGSLDIVTDLLLTHYSHTHLLI